MLNIFYYCTGLSSIVIPESVSLIGNYPFLGCSGLENIKVEGGNRYYDSRNNCNAILETLTNELILGCKNTTIPNGVVSIGREAFYECTDLTNITIPNSVTKIGKWAFYGCSHLTNIIIPGSVKNIASDSFQGCKDLNIIQVENNNSVYDSRSNCNAILETNTNTIVLGCKNTIIPSSVTSIGPSAFSGQKSMLSISIPNSITNIGDWAFYGCSGLTSVTIGNSVTSIGDHAFLNCSGLTSVTIPNSVTSIGGEAFYDCSSLTSVTAMMDNPVSIGSSTFSNRANATLYVPYGRKAAYEAADYWKEFKEIVELAAPSPVIVFADEGVKTLCVARWDTDNDGELSEAEAAAVTSLGGAFHLDHDNTIPSGISSFNELSYFTGLSSIEDGAFSGCMMLRNITIPNNVTSIGSSAFYHCDLNSITIPNSVTSIGNGAFLDCWGLTSITIPNSVTSIGGSAFYGTGWYNGQSDGILYLDNWLIGFKGEKPTGNLVIAEGTRGLASSAFSGCIGLTSITIPNSVTSIGEGTFGDCSGLTSVTAMMDNPVSIGSSTFSNRANATLYVPYGRKAAYEAADYWKEFKEIVELEKPVEVTDVSQLADAIYIESAEARCGTQATLSVKMKNSVAIQTIQFDLYLPDGITIVPNEDNELVTASKERINKFNYFQSSMQSDGGLRLLAQATNTNVPAGDGEICRIVVDIPESMDEGEYPLIIKKALMVEKNNTSHSPNPDLVQTKLTLLRYVPGDASGDGDVNAIDFNMIGNYILGDSQSGLNVKAADISGDGEVNAIDFNMVGNMILNGGGAAARMASTEEEKAPA